MRSLSRMTFQAIGTAALALPSAAMAQVQGADPAGSGPIVDALTWLQGTLLCSHFPGQKLAATQQPLGYAGVLALAPYCARAHFPALSRRTIACVCLSHDVVGRNILVVAKAYAFVLCNITR